MNQLVIRSLTFADVRAFLIWEQRVASSNPAAPTKKIKGLQVFICRPFFCLVFQARHAARLPHEFRQAK